MRSGYSLGEPMVMVREFYHYRCTVISLVQGGADAITEAMTDSPSKVTCWFCPKDVDSNGSCIGAGSANSSIHNELPAGTMVPARKRCRLKHHVVVMSWYQWYQQYATAGTMGRCYTFSVAAIHGTETTAFRTYVCVGAEKKTVVCPISHKPIRPVSSPQPVIKWESEQFNSDNERSETNWESERSDSTSICVRACLEESQLHPPCFVQHAGQFQSRALAFYPYDFLIWQQATNSISKLHYQTPTLRWRRKTHGARGSGPFVLGPWPLILVPGSRQLLVSGPCFMVPAWPLVPGTMVPSYLSTMVP